MSFTNFVSIFDRLPLVPRVLVMYHGGEPLLNPALPEMLKYAKSAGVSKTVLNTNGMLLTRQKADQLRGYIDEMRVSLDGSSPQENNLIRKGSYFYTVADNVLAAELPIVIYNVGAASTQFLIDAFGDIPIRSDKLRTWAVERQGMVTKKLQMCANLFQTFTVMADGHVVMCCEDITGDDIIGNVFDFSPLELWGKMAGRRSGFRHERYPVLCQTCHVLRDE